MHEGSFLLQIRQSKKHSLVIFVNFELKTRSTSRAEAEGTDATCIFKYDYTRCALILKHFESYCINKSIVHLLKGACSEILENEFSVTLVKPTYFL